MHRSIRDDDGFALAAVLGAIAIITVVATAGYFLAQSALTQSQYIQAESRAMRVAESGLDRELATFSPANVGTAYFPKYGSTPDGPYTITVDEQNTGSIMGEYLMTSRGRSSDSSESVSMRFFYLDLWKMNISAGDPTTVGGGRGWNGQAKIVGPMYVRGDFEWWANADYDGGPLLIRDGSLVMGGNGKLGYAAPIDLYVTGSYPVDQLNKRLFTSRISHTVPDIELPWIDAKYIDEMYAKAIAESKDNNMGSPAARTIVTTEALSFDPITYDTALAPVLNPRTSAIPLAANGATSTHYKYIGKATGPKALYQGTNDLVIGATSFGAWSGNGYPAASGLHDDFAFDVATGILYVEGTVFIDGSLTLGGQVKKYVGNGTLVCNGDVTINTALEPLSGAVSAEQCLGITTPGDVTMNDYFHGALFCNGTAGLYGTSTGFKGSILAGNIYGDKPNIFIYIDPNLAGALPESMPAAGGGMVFAGQWTRR
ncbi:MAG: hypothetical protein Q8K89_13540 [Actinomycetota bacterium]|nr:hypothetical protein [Actinomycetota bacterium]